MKGTLAALALSLSLLAAACGASAEGPPAIEVDRSACSHCGMLISEPLYAAAYRAPASDGRVFDDIGCLLAAARLEAVAPRAWFHDASGGGWIEAADAFFVASSEIRSPMGGGLLAYRDRAAAEQAAGRYRGTVVRSFEDLLRRKDDK